MTSEFKIKNKRPQETTYVLENASSGATGAGSIASAPATVGSVQRRKPDQNLINGMIKASTSDKSVVEVLSAQLNDLKAKLESLHGDSDTVRFTVDSDSAHKNVMKKFGNMIKHESEEVMSIPRKYWPEVQDLADYAGGTAEEESTDEDWGMSGADTAMSSQISPGSGGEMPVGRDISLESDEYTTKLNRSLNEKIPKGASAEYYIKDFEKSRAPQFKGKSKKKRKEMALAAHYGDAKKNSGVKESEGSVEGEQHISKTLLDHIVQQIKTDGVQALVKSLQWGDGAADELLQLITRQLSQAAQQMKESSKSDKY